MPARKTPPQDNSNLQVETSKGRDNETSQALIVRPLTTPIPNKEKSVGRPKKLTMPPIPQMAMNEVEQPLFDYFMQSYQEQYPDLLPTDLLLLYLAGLEFIKYLRVVAEELESGKVMSMARQHPGISMRALLDQLSVTRRARTQRAKPDDDEEAKEIREFFLQMSSRPQQKKS